MAAAPCIAIAFTTAALLLLCLGDPKRRRNARAPGEAHGRAARCMLVAASLLPGLILALGVDAAAFLIWLGGSAIAGWLLTMLTAARQRV